jgi:hypothetical protein
MTNLLGTPNLIGDEYVSGRHHTAKESFFAWFARHSADVVV